MDEVEWWWWWMGIKIQREGAGAEMFGQPLSPGRLLPLHGWQEELDSVRLRGETQKLDSRLK